MKLSQEQLDKLSQLFIDIAKGLFLAAIAIPAVTKAATLAESLRSLVIGLFFTYLSLKALDLKEVKK